MKLISSDFLVKFNLAIITVLYLVRVSSYTWFVFRCVLQDREEELSDRNDNLRSVNILGDKLVKQSSVNVDKKQIEDSLKKLNEHWNHVSR